MLDSNLDLGGNVSILRCDGVAEVAFRAEARIRVPQPLWILPPLQIRGTRTQVGNHVIQRGVLTQRCRPRAGRRSPEAQP